ncbi:hypothetical protein MSM1_08860 [Mycobacterium sp. SM1]|uniref:DUF6188 family protein n=1 Tax=Mycobacterium sp. SM1 TaxID=2816243 RepID=UPI001BD07AEA|nr:DUF6188 family protein [Mycobacterium sp. SM1]MBS4728442.1 hypothetical protein [Mycobacterium sp. SM1]
MLNQWIEGHAVQRITLRDGLVLSLGDHNQLVISGSLLLTLPPVGLHPVEQVIIDPGNLPGRQRPLLDFAGATCTRATCTENGHLHLEFSTGHQIDVYSDAHRIAWELYGKYRGYAVCLPGGRVRAVRHDLPEDNDTAVVPA